MRPSRKRLRSGLMIDDFIVLEEMEREAWRSITATEEKSEGSRRVQKIREAYEDAGLPKHPSKAVEQSTEGEFWGYQFDGLAGRARPNLKRLVPLAGIVLRTISSGHASVGLLEILAGSLTFGLSSKKEIHVGPQPHLRRTTRQAEEWSGEAVKIFKSRAASLRRPDGVSGDRYEVEAVEALDLLWCIKPCRGSSLCRGRSFEDEGTTEAWTAERLVVQTAEPSSSFEEGERPFWGGDWGAPRVDIWDASALGVYRPNRPVPSFWQSQEGED